MDLYGIAEPSCFRAVQHFEGTRECTQVLQGDEDMIEHILARHKQLGVHNVIYECGRCFVTFHTDHPLLTVQGSITRQEGLEGQLKDGSDIWLKYTERTCPLRKGLDVAAGLGLRMWGRLCMNRNYLEVRGKFACSRFWIKNREEMCEYNKDGSRDMTRVCYAFEDYQAERLAAITEAMKVAGPRSGRRLEGMTLDFVRQPPMLKYHPRLCDAYRKAAGVDPRTISSQDVEPFLAWCRWRAGILTDFMRKVRAQTKRLDASVKLIARITDLGPNVNIVEGVDVETWLGEGLIDGIVTSPLNWIRTVWEHDLGPYVRLARGHNVPVIAGVSLNQMTRFHRRRGSVNFAVLARRVRDYQAAGADGIALYQSECGLEFDGIEEVVPKFADPAATAALLADEAFLAKWPVTHLNCAYGLDCHSWFNNYTIDDFRSAEAGSEI